MLFMSNISSPSAEAATASPRQTITLMLDDNSTIGILVAGNPPQTESAATTVYFGVMLTFPDRSFGRSCYVTEFPRSAGAAAGCPE